MVLLPIFGQFHSCLLMDHCMDNSLCCFATSNTLLCLSFLGDDTDESHSHNLQMAFCRIYEVIGVTNVDSSINKWDELCLVRDFPISLRRLSSTSCADPDQPDLTSYRYTHLPHHSMQRSSTQTRSTAHNSSKSSADTMAPKRVLVVGAGAAGMSCADGLSNHPDRFEVTLIGGSFSLRRRPSPLADGQILLDAQPYCGGQAFSIPIDEERFGSKWMNQGVQGGSYIYQ